MLLCLRQLNGDISYVVGGKVKITEWKVCASVFVCEQSAYVTAHTGCVRIEHGSVSNVVFHVLF